MGDRVYHIGCCLWPLDNLRVIASHPCGFRMSLPRSMTEFPIVPASSGSHGPLLVKRIPLLVLDLVSASRSSVIPFDQCVLDLSITFGQHISERSLTSGQGISELLVFSVTQLHIHYPAQLFLWPLGIIHLEPSSPFKGPTLRNMPPF